MKTNASKTPAPRVTPLLCALGLLAGATLPGWAVMTPTAPTLSINRAGNTVTVSVKGAPQTAYSFCSSATGERSGAWSQITTVTANASGTASFTDVVNTNVAQQFYAVVQGENGMTGQPISLDATNIFSLNVVGYVNVTCPPGFSLIANPLNAGNNSLTNLIVNPPVGSSFYFYDNISGYSVYVFDDLDLEWTPSSFGKSLVPGNGGFFQNVAATSFTITFVGEVLQGSLTNQIPAGYFIASSMVPIQARLSEMGFPARPFDQVFVYNNTTGYSVYSFDDLDLVWSPGNPNGPLINVGQAFIANQLTAKTWVRNFTVQ